MNRAALISCGLRFVKGLVLVLVYGLVGGERVQLHEEAARRRLPERRDMSGIVLFLI